MAWHVFLNAAGQQWEMNFAGMRLLAHAYSLAKLMRGNYQKTTTKEHLAPFIDLPIININVNWDAINARLPATVRQFECDRPLWQSSLSQDTVEYLANIRRQTAALNAERLRVFDQASKENFANWSAFDRRFEAWGNVARLVRDTLLHGRRGDRRGIDRRSCVGGDRCRLRSQGGRRCAGQWKGS